MIDIDGGFGTMFVIASKGRREMPDSDIFLDGEIELRSRKGSFPGQFVCTSLRDAALHINAFNFPVWGMFEKLTPTLLAGVPAIVKPVTATCCVTELVVKLMLESRLLPKSVLQLVSGGLGDMPERLTRQDVVSFTGSAQTALKLGFAPNILKNAVRFVAEQDSLNASVPASDAARGSEEFDLFVQEVHRGMTTRAGQKCTAIRRILVPQNTVDATISALSARLSDTVVGDPEARGAGMGALVLNV